MAQTTIEWTATRGPDGTLHPGFTCNPWIGCHKVSPACKHCYAETLATNRMSLKVWGQGAPRRVTTMAYWRQPHRWNKQAQQLGVRLKVFCASLADVFEEHNGPIIGDVGGDLRPWHCLDDVRAALWALIDETPNLDWLLLTKRPENVAGMVPWNWLQGDWPRNVWVGCTVEDQEHADQRLPHLLKVPAPVRFVSYEPALGSVDWWPWVRKASCGMRNGPPLDWLICGGESGDKARPMHPDWARGARDACAAAAVPFLFKQWGELCPPDQLSPEAFRTWDAVENAAGNPDLSRPLRFGKKRAGRLLDGVDHSAWPEARP